MKRSLFVGAFLVVEGIGDKRVYGLVVDHEACLIEIAHGRENVLGAVRILNQAGVVAIIDSDASRIVGETLPEDNVLRTDAHDLECMILNSPAFDRVLEEFGSDDRVSAFADDSPLVARQLAINAALLGCLRLISIQDDLSLKFEGLKYSRFVESNRLTIDVVKMVREVINNSHKHALVQTQLVEQINDEGRKGHDCWQISCGHDIAELLSVAFRKTFSGRSGGGVTAEILERSLRLAYEAAHLKETMLYQAMVTWEQTNPTFPILKNTT